MKKHYVLFSLALLLAASALADVTVTGAWIRATVPQAKAGGAYLQLSSSQDARLIAVRSSVAGAVEIHHMEMNGQMMTMRAVSGIDLMAGKPFDLGASGYHIMLLDLKQQLKEGASVPLSLIVRNRDGKLETTELMVPVKALTYIAPAAAH